jgi:hypothetical protein
MPANRRIPPRPAAEARRDLASESQSMRYLTRCHSAEEAAPSSAPWPSSSRA